MLVKYNNRLIYKCEGKYNNEYVFSISSAKNFIKKHESTFLFVCPEKKYIQIYFHCKSIFVIVFGAKYFCFYITEFSNDDYEFEMDLRFRHQEFKNKVMQYF